MGFFNSLIGAATNLALTPVAAVVDVLTVGDGEGSATAKSLASAAQNAANAVQELV